MTILEQSAGTSVPPKVVQQSAPPSAQTGSSVGALPWTEGATQIAPKDGRALSKLLFQRLRELQEGTREYQYARNTLIEMNQSLVRFAASRFRNRGGGEMEDILDIGTIGLIKGIDRFVLSGEVEFTSFGIPCILGELERYFPDSTETPDAGDDDNDDGQVNESGRTYADTLGTCDPALEFVEDFHTLAPLLDLLDDRARHIIELRFGQEMTQSQIGEKLGVSQVHISRLLKRALDQLRTGMLTDH
ncbi:sigma-70 family RNA polymerase sigma factor [Streptomyces hypolithicus]